MNQTNSSKQVLLSVIGVAILVVAVVGVSFAFFNYTRTGEANTVRTGTIYFTSSNDLIAVNNLFPVSRTDSRIDAAANDTNDIVGVAVVTIKGYTTYAGGVDYMVTAEDVDFNIATVDGDVQLPISVRVTQTGLGTGANATEVDVTSVNIGTEAVDYHQLGGTNENKIQLYQYELPDGTTTIDQRSAFRTLNNGTLLAKGHIKTGTDLGTNNIGATSSVTGYSAVGEGTITIRAYIDKDMIAITDTRATGTNGNVYATGYENGTSEDWVRGRTVFTTAQWNSLNTVNATFRIKVVAGETHTTSDNVTGATASIIGAY